MKKSKHIYLLIISIVMAILWIINSALVQSNYILNIQGYSPFPIGLWFFSFSGLFGYLFLMFNIPNVYKLLASMFAAAAIIIIGISFGLSAENVEIVEIDEYTFIISEDSFLFSGYTTFYEQKNVVFSKFVTTCDIGEDIACTYSVINSNLEVTECGHHSGTCITKKFPVGDEHD